MGHRGHKAGRYICKPAFESDGCGSLSIHAKLADAYLTTAVIAAVGSGLPAVEVYAPAEVGRLEEDFLPWPPTQLNQ